MGEPIVYPFPLKASKEKPVTWKESSVAVERKNLVLPQPMGQNSYKVKQLFLGCFDSSEET
jgi:hypothetical protein